MIARNRLFLLAGAGALALSGAAAAQDAEGAPGMAQDEDASPRDVNDAAHERLRDEGGFVAPGEQAAGEEALEDEAARSERVARSPHPAHTAEDRFVDDELVDNRVDPDSAEAALVREALEGNQSLAEMAETGDADAEATEEVLDAAEFEGEQNSVPVASQQLDERDFNSTAESWDADAEDREVNLIRTFAQIDADGDFLITPREWRIREGGDAIAPFTEVDLNGTGRLGFAEYRAWTALQRAEDDGAEGSGG